MLIRVIEREPQLLNFFSDQCNIQGIYKRPAEEVSSTLELLPDYYETPKLCNEIIEEDLVYVIDHFITQEKCNEAVEEETYC